MLVEAFRGNIERFLAHHGKGNYDARHIVGRCRSVIEDRGCGSAVFFLYCGNIGHQAIRMELLEDASVLLVPQVAYHGVTARQGRSKAGDSFADLQSIMRNGFQGDGGSNRQNALMRDAGLPIHEDSLDWAVSSVSQGGDKYVLEARQMPSLLGLPQPQGIERHDLQKGRWYHFVASLKPSDITVHVYTHEPAHTHAQRAESYRKALSTKRVVVNPWPE